MSSRHPSLAWLVALSMTALSSPVVAGCSLFRRGDANADGVADLADAVFTLEYLFSSGDPATCEDAADADDNGAVELPDAVYLLGYLFLGLPPPPAPGPHECGAEETDDDLGCEMQGLCDPPGERRDLSGSERFEYRQEPTFWFCPDTARILEATVTRQPDGSDLLELSLVRRGGEPGEECLFPFRTELPCFVREPFPTRALTPGEAAALRGRFADMTIHSAPDPMCRCYATDACVYSTFTWDATKVSLHQCSPSHVDRASAAAVLDLLETFRPRQ